MVRTKCAMPAGDRSIDGGSRSGSGSRPRQRSEPVASSLACNFDLNVIFGAKFSGYNPPVPQTTMQVTLPEMGESVTEGTIAKWLKQPGDQVREGEGLVEVTTDKVDAEVPAPASGTLVKIFAEAGKTVAVGTALAEIAVGAEGDGATKRQAPTLPSPASEGAKGAPPEATAGPAPAPAAAPNGGPKAAPVEVSGGSEPA